GVRAQLLESLDRETLDRRQAHRAEDALAARHADLALGDLDSEEPHHEVPSGSVTAVRSSSVPPAPSSTTTSSSTARGSSGAVHDDRHVAPSKHRMPNRTTSPSASMPRGSGRSAGAKRDPTRRTITPRPGARGSTW